MGEAGGWRLDGRFKLTPETDPFSLLRWWVFALWREENDDFGRGRTSYIPSNPPLPPLH